MVTGELPFRSAGPLEAWMKKVQNDLTPPRKINPGLSERVDWAIRRAMAVQADHRPATCREFVEDLTGHSTRRVPLAGAESADGELWYMVYVDEAGQQHTVKGTTPAIRRSLKEGLLGDAANVRAARSKAGPFEMLHQHLEFRDLALARVTADGPDSVDAPAPPSASTPLPARTKSTRREATERPAPSTQAPHIQLGAAPDSSGSWEWVKWLVLLAVALATAAAAYYLLPDSLFRGWWVR